METNPITFNTLIRVLVVVVVLEAMALAGIKLIPIPPLAILGLTRGLQIIGILLWAIRSQGESGLVDIGWNPAFWIRGLKMGLLWALGFAGAAGAGMAAGMAMGYDLQALLDTPLPHNQLDLMLFFIVGGFIAPIAEEICFRGVIYTFMRDLAAATGRFLRKSEATNHLDPRWLSPAAVAFAMIASTFVFTILHAYHGLPVTQIIGGLVFALAYETSRNLMVPMVIHILGNLAIFSLSFLS
jgi:membrane protease YdiL (CAAX protease family)